jgi:hypothetical protein
MPVSLRLGGEHRRADRATNRAGFGIRFDRRSMT